jgi:hypothetical protein
LLEELDSGVGVGVGFGLVPVIKSGSFGNSALIIGSSLIFMSVILMGGLVGGVGVGIGIG